MYPALRRGWRQRSRRRLRIATTRPAKTENASQEAGPADPATLHPPPPPLVVPVCPAAADPPAPVPPVPLPPVPVPPPPVPLPPVPVALDPPAPLDPAAPPFPPPPLGASLGFVKEQELLLVQVAPSAAHLQSESLEHQPSMPFGCVPAGLHVKVGSE
jgi:hypothetical protein